MADVAMGPRLHFVVGKGGVGKSTVSAALALAARRQGAPVLAVELGEPGGLARLLTHTPTAAGVPVEVRPGLFLAYVEGEAALAEYLELVVPIRRVLNTVLRSRLYRLFVAAAPGLKELMTIGKIWYEHQKQGEDGAPLWRTIVVDAGASGHSLQYLQMPRAAARTFTSGLVHREATRVERLLRDPAHSRVHVVATPEDMPVAEACDILERLRNDLGMPVGRIFANRTRTLPPSNAANILAELGAASVPSGFTEELCEGVRVAAARDLAWCGVQARALGMLSRAAGDALVALPLIVVEEFGSAELDILARHVSVALEAER